MTYQQLLSLPLLDLIEKYKEVLKTEPAADANKQQLASAVAKALVAEPDKLLEGENPPEPETPLEDNKEVLKTEPAADVLQLEMKDEKGNVIDTMTLPKATWNNLPKSYKKLWTLKTPTEIV